MKVSAISPSYNGYSRVSKNEKSNIPADKADSVSFKRAEVRDNWADTFNKFESVFYNGKPDADVLKRSRDVYAEYISEHADDFPDGTVIEFDVRRDVDKLNEKELTNYRKDNLGFIFQSYNLIANLNVLENVELGKELAKEPLNIKDLLELVGLKEHMKKYPYQLSGGQMQRVAIARAVVKNPSVLFCDEPTGALDEKTGKIVLSLLQEINQKYHTTIIIVTHNPSIALMANTVVKMNSGRIVSITKNKDIARALDLRWA